MFISRYSKGTGIACLLSLLIFSAGAQTYSSARHPQMHLTYSYHYKYRGGVKYKDSTVNGYYFGNDSKYIWPVKDVWSDRDVSEYFKNEKKALKYIGRIRRINNFYEPLLMTFLGLSTPVVLVLGYSVFPVNPLIALTAIGVFSGSLSLFIVSENREEKALVKAAKIYNRDNGYCEAGVK